MPVRITDIAAYNRFRPEPVNWMLANVGDTIRFELTFVVQTYIVSSPKSPIVLNATNGFVGSGWIYFKSGGFTDFIVGDTILYCSKTNGIGNNQYFTVLEKPNNSTIRVSGPILAADNITSLANDCSFTDVIISVATPITAVRYKWNFIENNDQPTFMSKVSGTEHQLVIKSTSAAAGAPLPMIFLDEKSYQTGSATVQGIDIEAIQVYTSTFKVVHTTRVTPYMLSKDWQDLLKGINAPYFQNNKCLKAIFDVHAATDYNNPNWIQMQQITSVLGETGGYNENFNSGINNYTVDSVTFTNPSGDILSAIALSTVETNVDIILKNTIDAPFSNNNTQFELQFIKAPYDPSEYQLNGRTIDQNFIDDRAFQKIGSASINGEQFGVADRQVLKGVTGAFISTSQIRIRCKVAMLPGVLAVLAESQEPRYMLMVAIQNHAIPTKLADLVRLTVSVSPLFIDTSDPTMVGTSIIFKRHYEDKSDVGTPAMVIGPEDEVVADNVFFVDKTGRTGDNIVLASILCRIKAKNAVTGAEFTLDSFTMPLTALPVINGNQFVAFSLDRIFLIPDAEIRKKIQINRRSDLDNGNKYYYDVSFPFVVRWEDWIQLTTDPTNHSSDVFFDTTQKQNGINHDWYRYSVAADWGIYYEFTSVWLKNGVPQPFKQERKLAFFNYASNPAWGPKTIKSYDPNTLVELFDPVTSKKYLYAGKDTLIETRFTAVSGTANITDAVVNMHIEVFEEGGIAGTRRMSSKWPSVPAGTWFKSIDLSNKTVLDLIGLDTIRARVLVDGTLLPASKSKVKIQVRLYDPLGEIICVCPEGWTFDEVKMVCFKIVSGSSSKAGNMFLGGYGWGLNYNVQVGGKPTYFLTSNMATLEGCTCISDIFGALFAYSDGTNLFDYTNTLIAGPSAGTPLGGDASSSQSGVFIRKGGTTNDYYLFSISLPVGVSGGAGSLGTGNLVYCIVLNPNNTGPTPALAISGRGTILAGPGAPVENSQVGEKLTARQNGDGSDWVLTKEFNVTLAHYFAFYIDPNGVVNTTPVSTSSGAASTSGNVGQIKLNVDGTLFVSASYLNFVELWDFDASPTGGGLTNKRILNLPHSFSYGVEFDSKSKYLYVSLDQRGAGNDAIYRFDLTGAMDAATINASIIPVGAPSLARCGALQLDPNSDILVATCQTTLDGANFISILRDPSELSGPVTYAEDIPINATGTGHGTMPTQYPVGTLITPGVNRSSLSLPTFPTTIFSNRLEMPCGAG